MLLSRFLVDPYVLLSCFWTASPSLKSLAASSSSLALEYLTMLMSARAALPLQLAVFVVSRFIRFPFLQVQRRYYFVFLLVFVFVFVVFFSAASAKVHTASSVASLSWRLLLFLLRCCCCCGWFIANCANCWDSTVAVVVAQLSCKNKKERRKHELLHTEPRQQLQINTHWHTHGKKGRNYCICLFFNCS